MKRYSFFKLCILAPFLSSCLTLEVSKKTLATFQYQGVDYKIVGVEPGATSDDAVVLYKEGISIYNIKGTSEISNYYCTDSLLTFVIKQNKDSVKKIIVNLNKL